MAVCAEGDDGMGHMIDSSTGSKPDLVGLLGAGDQAREVASYLPLGTEIFWAVSPEYLGPAGRDQVDITAPPASVIDAAVVGAVGAPALRRDLVSAWPGERFTTVVSEVAHVDPSCLISPGTVVAPGAILSVNVVVGEHCLVNIGVTLSHDVHLSPYVTVSPGVHIAGRVRVGAGAFIGIGACISNDVTLAPGVVVGAGAVVLRDVTTPNALVAGVPASVIKIREGWLNAF